MDYGLPTSRSSQWTKLVPRAKWLRFPRAVPLLKDDEQTAQIRQLLKDSGVGWIDWIYRDGSDVLFAADGCVYRLGDFTTVPATLSLHDAQLLADFRDRQFTLVSAPAWALS